MDGFRKKFDPTKDNRVLGSVRKIVAWLRPVIVPGVTSPGDWAVVKLPSGLPAYVETRELRQA